MLCIDYFFIGARWPFDKVFEPVLLPGTFGRWAVWLFVAVDFIVHIQLWGLLGG